MQPRLEDFANFGGMVYHGSTSVGKGCDFCFCIWLFQGSKSTSVAHDTTGDLIDACNEANNRPVTEFSARIAILEIDLTGSTYLGEVVRER